MTTRESGGVVNGGNTGGAGGGGAGGYRAATGFAVAPLTVYNITVGGGGASGVGGASQGGTGGNSIFSTITANGLLFETLVNLVYSYNRF